MTRSDPHFESLVDKLLGLMTEDLEKSFVKAAPIQLAGFDIIPGGSIAFTGTLENYTRGSASSEAESVGLKVQNSINATLKYLVVGNKTESQSKIDKAAQRGAIILDENQFETLLEALR